MDEIKTGDIVQIVTESHAWFPALLIVDEAKNWGVLAVVLFPISNTGDDPIGRAYNRLPYDIIKKVGEAKVIPE